MTEEKTKTKKVAKKADSQKKAAKKSETIKREKPNVISDNFAVIKTGGKQYVVQEGKRYDFEKLNVKEGKTVEFSEVLLAARGGDVKIGQPMVKDAKVTGKVVSQFKDKKITVLKYKPKKRYRKTHGHRQAKTKVEITKIA